MRHWIMTFLTLSILVLLLAGCSKPENQGEGQKTGEQAKENPPVPEKSPSVSDEVLTNAIGMKFKLIPAGSFMMGSPESEKDRKNNEGPQHKVTLTKPFYLGVYEVTQEQYEKVMGSNPSTFKGAKLPVETVNWDDAQKFCRELSQSEKGMTYRLPTEAEWEYAARAGTKTAYYWGDDFDGRYAWCGQKSGGTREVGTRPPNAWGFFDMSGNVWEWCEDWYYGGYPTSKQVDPKGAASGSGLVNRGGSWDGVPQFCRSACRGGSTPDNRNDYLGFRVVAVPAAGK